MKINRISYLVVALLLLQGTVALCQLSDENWDLMLVREDRVYPSMTNEYEMSLMDMKEFLTSKDVKGFNYFTHMQDDYIFAHVTPIEHFKELGNGIHSLVSKKVKDPEFDLILDYLKEAIEYYRYYIVRYRPELSYIPEGDDWGIGSPYRKWSYYYFQPGTEKEVEAVLSAWKSLYKEKGIKSGFRVFSGFLGIEQPLYMLTTWAENPLDYHEKLQKVSGLLGEDGAVLWETMVGFVNEATAVEGWFLPKYSYAPGLKLAQ